MAEPPPGSATKSAVFDDGPESWWASMNLSDSDDDGSLAGRGSRTGRQSGYDDAGDTDNDPTFSDVTDHLAGLDDRRVSTDVVPPSAVAAVTAPRSSSPAMPLPPPTAAAAAATAKQSQSLLSWSGRTDTPPLPPAAATGGGLGTSGVQSLRSQPPVVDRAATATPTITWAEESDTTAAGQSDGGGEGADGMLSSSLLYNGRRDSPAITTTTARRSPSPHRRAGSAAGEAVPAAASPHGSSRGGGAGAGTGGGGGGTAGDVTTDADVSDDAGYREHGRSAGAAPLPSTAGTHLNLSPERKRSWLERAQRRRKDAAANQRFRKPDHSDPATWVELAEAWVQDLLQADSVVNVSSTWNRVRRALAAWRPALLEAGAPVTLMQQAADMPPPNEPPPGAPRVALPAFCGTACFLLGAIRGQVQATLSLTGPGSHLDVALQSRDMAVAQRKIAVQDRDAALARMEAALSERDDAVAELEDARQQLADQHAENNREMAALQDQLADALRKVNSAKSEQDAVHALRRRAEAERDSALAKLKQSPRKAPFGSSARRTSAASVTGAELSGGDFDATPAAADGAGAGVIGAGAGVAGGSAFSTPQHNGASRSAVSTIPEAAPPASQRRSGADVVVHKRSSGRRSRRTPASARAANAHTRGRSDIMRVGALGGGHRRSSSTGPAIGKRPGFGSSAPTGRMGDHLPWERPSAPIKERPSSPALPREARFMKPTSASSSKLRRPRASSAEPRSRRRGDSGSVSSPLSVAQRLALSSGPHVLKYYRAGKLRDSFESRASEASDPAFGSSSDRFSKLVGSGVDLKHPGVAADEAVGSVSGLLVDRTAPSAGAVQREMFGKEPRVLSKLNQHGVVDRKGHVPDPKLNPPAATAHRAAVVRPTNDTKLW